MGELVLNLAYVFLLVSMLAARLLWVRAAMVLSGLAFIWYFASVAVWAGVLWNVAFVVGHVVQIARLLYRVRNQTCGPDDCVGLGLCEHVRGAPLLGGGSGVKSPDAS